MKKTIDFCEKGCSNSLVVFIIIFFVLMKIRIGSEYVPRIKIIIFADFMYYSIVIVADTHAQNFDNLISK